MQWFSERFKVGGMPNPMDLDPNGRLSGYDVFVNVCDVRDQSGILQIESIGARSHWFPLGEVVGMCVGSIYGALQTLFDAYIQGKAVYLHCAAGINRSQTVADCFYFMMTKEHRPSPWKYIGGGENAPGVMLLRNCERGKLPTLPIMEKWLGEMAGAVYMASGGELDMTRIKAGFVWQEPKEATSETTATLLI